MLVLVLVLDIADLDIYIGNTARNSYKIRLFFYIIIHSVGYYVNIEGVTGIFSS